MKAHAALSAACALQVNRQLRADRATTFNVANAGRIDERNVCDKFVLNVLFDP